jgi:outer membrane protein TolC
MRYVRTIGTHGARRLPVAAAAVTMLLLSPALSRAQSTGTAGEQGTIAVPTSPPPTGLQAPLPSPIGKIPPADHPVKTSPSLNALSASIASHPLTINDAVAVALATNRSLALANEALLLAQGRTAEARAALNPTIGGTFTYTRLNQGSTANFGGQTITIVSADQPVLTAQVTLPVDIMGMTRAAVDQSKFNEIAERLDVNRTRNQIVSDVKTAFYNVLRSQALVAVATDSLTDSQERLADAQKKLQAGTVARFDVIRAQTDVANAEQQLIQARTTVSQNIATLNSTIGIDVDTPTRISDEGAVETPPGVSPVALLDNNNGAGPPVESLPPVTPGAEPKRPPVQFDSLALGPDYDAIEKEALATRPEVLESDAQIAAARKGITLARRSLTPTLGLSLGGQYNPLASSFGQAASASLVASVGFTIFDGGIAKARTQEARAQVANAETTRRQTVDQVVLDLRTTYLSLVQARDQVAVANQALAEAQESFRLARVRYNAGVSSQAGISPLLEVTDAQAALTQAQTNQVNALYAYNEARANLDRAIGRYSYVANAPGYASPTSVPGSARSGNGGK